MEISGKRVMQVRIEKEVLGKAHLIIDIEFASVQEAEAAADYIQEGMEENGGIRLSFDGGRIV